MLLIKIASILAVLSVLKHYIKEKFQSKVSFLQRWHLNQCAVIQLVIFLRKQSLMHSRLGILCQVMSHYAIIKTKSTWEFLKISMLGAIQTAAQDLFTKRIKKIVKFWCHLLEPLWTPSRCKALDSLLKIFHSFLANPGTLQFWLKML